MSQFVVGRSLAFCIIESLHISLSFIVRLDVAKRAVVYESEYN